MTQRSPSYCALLAGALVLLCAAEVRAQNATLPLTLEWTAPEGCPSAAVVDAHVRNAVQVPAGTSLPDVTARVVVVREGGTYAMRMETTRGGELGVREVTATSCNALAQAATLVLALTFGAGVDLEATLPEPSDSPEVVAPPPVPEAAPVHAADDEDEHTGIDGRLGLALATGLLPRAAYGMVGSVGLRADHVHLESAFVFFPRTVDEVRGFDIDAEYRAMVVETSICVAGERPFAFLEPCVRIVAGAVRGETRGAAEDGRERAPYVATGVSLGVGIPPRRPVSAAMSIALDVPIVRPSFAIENIGVVHRTRGVVVVLEVAVRFAQ